MDVQVLATKVEEGFKAIRERLDDTKEVSAERHDENVQRLETIDRDVRAINGRVTRVEEQVKTLFDRIADLARTLTGQKGANGGLTPVTFFDVGRWCVIVGAAVAFTWWFLTVVLQWGPKP